MNYVRNNLEIFIHYAIQQAIVAAVLTIVCSLAGSELSDTVASAVSALAQLGWDQLFSPSPPTPAGDITARMIRIWTSYVVAGVTPALRQGCPLHPVVQAGSVVAAEQRALGFPLSP